MSPSRVRRAESGAAHHRLVLSEQDAHGHVTTSPRPALPTGSGRLTRRRKPPSGRGPAANSAPDEGGDALGEAGEATAPGFSRGDVAHGGGAATVIADFGLDGGGIAREARMVQCRARLWRITLVAPFAHRPGEDGFHRFRVSGPTPVPRPGRRSRRRRASSSAPCNLSRLGWAGDSPRPPRAPPRSARRATTFGTRRFLSRRARVATGRSRPASSLFRAIRERLWPRKVVQVAREAEAFLGDGALRQKATRGGAAPAFERVQAADQQPQRAGRRAPCR